MRNSHSVRLKYNNQGRFLTEGVSESTARQEAQAYSQSHKNRAVEVVDRHGNVKALFLNGRDVS